MDLKRRNYFVFGLLAAVWLLVIAWQIGEHRRVKEVAQAGLAKQARKFADTMGAFIRALKWGRSEMVHYDRVEPVMKEMVNERTNQLVRSSELVWIALLNAANEPLASAGVPTIELTSDVVLPENGLWARDTVTLEFTVAGVPLDTNQALTVVAPPLREMTNNPPPPDGSRGGRNWRDSRGDGPEGMPPPPDRPEMRPDKPPGADGRDRPRRPFWARGMEESEYLAMIQRRELHGLVVALSTGSYQHIVRQDIRMRCVIIFFSGISALGVALAWRSLSKSGDLQLRLVRASEMNTHLKEMNLAAAGLAHETRNPLNIIRGMAQMIFKQPEVPEEIRERTRAIVDETDKVTAQLNEFINYSRPREVRRSAVPLHTVLNEVARALSYDIEEKKIRVEVKGDQVSIEADEQMLRQVLFNLVLNSIQALGEGGEIQIVTQRSPAGEASLEIRDNGPGVPPERRKEIFKPYFTTQQKGTGLGLAIVQQIVLAHGWDIECLTNDPKGAVFRITHLKLSGKA